MVKTDDMHTPEKHERDEFSPGEYIAGGHNDSPGGYLFQFDDDERDPWDEYRRNKDMDEDDDYLKEDEEEEIFEKEPISKPIWSIGEEEEEEEPAPVVSGVAPAAPLFAPEPAP